MDLFLKTAEEQNFVLVNLVGDIFGGDLVDSLQLRSPLFILVVVRSVLNKDPTMAPSFAPTLIPSTAPSQKPTEVPSNEPSFAPTPSPSRGPTVSPTPGPTAPPSAAPTGSPTTTPPTLVPSVDPTLAPSIDPTPTPTLSPTMAPSESPSTSSSPTGEFDGYFEPLDRPIRIACAGDSLTLGTFGGQPVDSSYPSQLQQMLGENFEVYNFGRNSVTALRGLSVSYVDTTQFEASLNFEPDVYLLMLGTNDAGHWEVHGHKYQDDMEWIVNKLRSSISMESSARIIVAIPPWIKDDGAYGTGHDILVGGVQPAIETIARLEALELVSMYDVTYNQVDNFLGDGLHLSKKGNRSLATAWKVAIECNHDGICETGENCVTCPGDCYLNCSGPTLPPAKAPSPSLLPNTQPSTSSSEAPSNHPSEEAP